MNPKLKAVLKFVLIVFTVGIVAFLVWEVIKAIRAGERTISGILNAPKTAAKAVWSGLKSFFSGAGSGSSSSGDLPTITNADTAGITSADGTPITADTALATLLLGGQPIDVQPWDQYLAQLQAQ